MSKVRTFESSNNLEGTNFVPFQPQVPISFQFFVLDTDYTIFAVVSMCGIVPMMNKSVQLFLILGRQTTMESVYVEKALAALKKFQPTSSDYVAANQNRCTA